MNGSVRIVGEPLGVLANLPAELRQACWPVVSDGGDPSPRLLINLEAAAGLAIAAATAFANAASPVGGDRLVVSIWQKSAPAEWEANRYAAEMAAFTRYAALAWAPKQVRVNAVIIDAAATAGSSQSGVAATILALWRWRSMTGQVINLAG